MDVRGTSSDRRFSPDAPTTKKPFTVAVMRHSGTHLITPIVRYLTGKTVYSPKGDSSLVCRPSPVVIVFLRDPRNWLVSVYKWKRAGRAAPPGGMAGPVDSDLAAFMAATSAAKPISYLDFAKRWADRWVDWPGALTVRFEDLQTAATGVPEVERIKAFLGPAATGHAGDVYGRVFGKSGTYTGRPSDWHDWFGPMTAKAWKRHGGAELVKTMGYV